LIKILVYVNVIMQELLTQVYVQYVTPMWQTSVIIHQVTVCGCPLTGLNPGLLLTFSLDITP